MAKRGRLERVLEQLRAARSDPDSAASREALRRALADRSPHAVARAARIVGELELAGYEAALAAAFDRFLADPGADTGCAAKTAAADALYRIGSDLPELFLRGIRCVQLEPVFGGKADVAVELRGTCALGLVRCGYRDALGELAELLADREAPARIAAARALAYRGGADGAPLLKLKARLGDAEPEVTAECLAALLRLDGGAIGFVRGFLDDPTTAEPAALALGESRLGGAFEALREFCEARSAVPAGRRLACRALALLRRDDAFDYLVERVEHAPAGLAADALAELASCRGDEALRGRVEAAVTSRGDEALAAAFRREFADP